MNRESAHRKTQYGYTSPAYLDSQVQQSFKIPVSHLVTVGELSLKFRMT